MPAEPIRFTFEDYILPGAVAVAFLGVVQLITPLFFGEEWFYLARNSAVMVTSLVPGVVLLPVTILIVDRLAFKEYIQNDCNADALVTEIRDLIENQNANTRSIMDFLTQDKISTLTAENQALKFAASQAQQNAFITANQDAQTAELIRRLGRDCPVPAYVVPNPNCCYGNPLGVGYGYNGGCGCTCG